MSARRNRLLRPLILALSIGAALPAMAGTTCQLLDGSSADAGDDGADAGVDNGGGQDNATACGRNAKATSAAATAFGSDAQATGIGSMALGYATRATQSSAIALGSNASATGIWSMSLGSYASAGNWGAISLGTHSNASGQFSASVGVYSQATGSNAVAFGNFLGSSSDSLVSGRYTTASGSASAAFGAAAHAMASHSSALGANSQVASSASNSVALGADSVAADANVVSFGHAASDLDNLGAAYGSDLDRRLTHVADGTADTDAVNLRQLNTAIAGVSTIDLSPVAAALGGGASYSGGVFAAPSYSIQGVSYHDAGSAFSAIDAWISSHGSGVQYDDASHGTVTLSGASGTQLKNVAAATDSTDAVNLQQIQSGSATMLASANAHADAGDAATLVSANAHADAGDATTLAASKSYADSRSEAAISTANAYTDARFASWDDDLTRFRSDVEHRLASQDRRISRQGAMGSAMSAAAINTAGLPGDNRLGVGAGMQSGQVAVAIGYQHLMMSNVSVSLGGAFSGGENSVSAGAGFSW